MNRTSSVDKQTVSVGNRRIYKQDTTEKFSTGSRVSVNLYMR